MSAQRLCSRTLTLDSPSPSPYTSSTACMTSWRIVCPRAGSSIPLRTTILGVGKPS